MSHLSKGIEDIATNRKYKTEALCVNTVNFQPDMKMNMGHSKELCFAQSGKHILKFITPNA